MLYDQLLNITNAALLFIILFHCTNLINIWTAEIYSYDKNVQYDFEHGLNFGMNLLIFQII
jgi:hypothetical protein